jgi:integrase
MKRPKDKKLPRGVFIRNGAYWIRYADQNGIIHREKVGPFLDPAKAAVEKRRSEVREGKFFPEKIKQRSVLFGEIAKDYKEHAKRMKRDWKHDDARIELLLKTLKDIPVHELTPGRLEGVLAELTERNAWAPATYNRYRAILSGAFRFAIKRGKAQTNPVRETAHRKENNARVRYLTDKEEKRLMNYARANCPEREAEILTALHSGLRRSEQYRTAQVPDGGLKWEHVNPRASIIRLPRSKAERPREIPINSVLRKALLSVSRTTSPYVFEGTDPNKWFVEVCREAKVKDFHWHDLRHTFASRLAMAGVPIRAIADLMGHTQVQTTARYAHLAPGYPAEAVEKLVAPIPTTQEDQTDTAIDTEVLELSAAER